MHRKYSSIGRRSRIRGRNSGGVHRQVQKIFQTDWPRSASEKEGEIFDRSKHRPPQGFLLIQHGLIHPNAPLGTTRIQPASSSKPPFSRSSTAKLTKMTTML